MVKWRASSTKGRFMTVAELIEKLKAFDPTPEVWLRARELSA